MHLHESVKRVAIEVGFDLVGVAPVTPGDDLEFARDWLKRGYGGEMRYLTDPKRFDPCAVLPSVKSMVCVGLIYNTPFPYSTQVHSEGVRSQEPGVGRQWPVASGQLSFEGCSGHVTTDNGDAGGAGHAWISRYAWGRDYHEVMREKLERLRSAIEELAPRVETRVFVDTGPVVERAFARFSGIGWMGKNTCIINEEKGSWFFLGIILTNLELTPDLPAPDRCGTCRACLDACPTGALVEPYVMDASRCISYLTIELKGPIPRELRSGIGRNIFGCDICQDVCPWNAKDRSQVSGDRCQESSFQPMTVNSAKLETGNSKLGRGPRSPVSSRQSGNPKSSITNHQLPVPSAQHPEPSTFSLFNPPLKALAAMTEEDFRRIFACSPIKRAKYRGWLRNLSVAMGNSGDARFVPKLRELTRHSDPIVREHAVWALDRLHSS